MTATSFVGEDLGSFSLSDAVSLGRCRSTSTSRTSPLWIATVTWWRRSTPPAPPAPAPWPTTAGPAPARTAVTPAHPFPRPRRLLPPSGSYTSTATSSSWAASTWCSSSSLAVTPSATTSSFRWVPGVPHRLWLLLHLRQRHHSGEYLVFLIIFGCYSICYNVIIQVSTWCSSSSLAVTPSATTSSFRWVPGVPHRLWLLLHLRQRHHSGEYLVFLIVFGCYSICDNVIIQVSTWCSSSSLAVTPSATTSSFRWVPGVPHHLWLLLHLLQRHHSGEYLVFLIVFGCYSICDNVIIQVSTWCSSSSLAVTPSATTSSFRWVPGVPHHLWLLLHLRQRHHSGEYLVFLIVFGCYSICDNVIIQVSTWCSSSSLAVTPSATTSSFRWVPGVPHRLWLLLHLRQHHHSGEYLVFLIVFGCYSICDNVIIQVSTWCSSSSLAVTPSATTSSFRWVPGVPHRLWLLLHLRQHHHSGEYLVFLIVFGCYSICYNIIIQVSTWCSSSSLAVTPSATTSSFRWVPGVPHHLWLLLHLLQHHHSGECCRHLVWAARSALSFCVAVLGWLGGGGGGCNSISNTIIVQVTIFSKYSITQIRWRLQLPGSLVGIPFAADWSGCCGTRQANGPKFTPPGSEMPPG